MSKCAVFISSTSDLHHARDLVAKVLISLGYDPMWQDIEATHGGELLEVLRKRIDPCSIVLQLIGSRYGAEPPMPPEGMQRCSYTQYEALYAESIAKKVVYIRLKDGFPETPASPQPAELVELQRRYCEGLAQRNSLRHEAGTLESLENRVLRLRDELAAVRERFERRQRRTLWMAAATLAIVTITLGVGIWQFRTVLKIGSKPSWLTRALTETGLDASAITENDFVLTPLPYPSAVDLDEKGLIDVKLSDRLQRVGVSDNLEVRLGTEPWQTVYSNTGISPSNLFAMIGERDINAGKPLQLRVIDRSNDEVIGPFSYDVDGGNLVREARRAEALSGHTWLVSTGHYWSVDERFLMGFGTLIRSMRVGRSPEALDVQIDLPSVPTEHADSDAAMKYRVALSMAAQSLAQKLNGVDRPTEAFGQVVLIDGTVGPITRFASERE